MTDTARTRSAHWPAVIMISMIMLISVLYGFQYLYQGSGQIRAFQAASVPFLLGLAWLTWHAVSSWDTTLSSASVPSWLGFGLMTGSFVMTIYFYSPRLGPIPWYLLAGIVPVLAWYCGRRWGAMGINMAYVACAFSLYVYFVASVPHTAGANMLEVIEAAATDFLKGENPYHMYEPISGAPFGYLPGLWLPYAVLVGAGIDVRVFNLLALLFLIFLFERTTRESGRGAMILSLSFYPIILSPPVAQMVMHGHVWPYWVLLILMASALCRGKHFAAAALFGLILATRQPAIFLIGPLMVYALRTVGAMAAARMMVVGTGAALLIYLPFYIWVGQSFWDATFLNLLSTDPKLFQVHFSGRSLLMGAGLEYLAKYLQAGITLLAIVVVAFRPRLSPAWLLFFAGATYAWLVALAPYAFRYEYLPAFLLMAFSLAGQRTERTEYA